MLSFGDHPRLRGEHIKRGTKLDCMEGSPPPTRGTRKQRFNNIRTVRITPAYAGNTKCTMLKGQKSRDHPRLRGEHYLRYRPIRVKAGSPPPTRGTHYFLGNLIPVQGITPAYAGNTKNPERP